MRLADARFSSFVHISIVTMNNENHEKAHKKERIQLRHNSALKKQRNMIFTIVFGFWF